MKGLVKIASDFLLSRSKYVCFIRIHVKIQSSCAAAEAFSKVVSPQYVEKTVLHRPSSM